METKEMSKNLVNFFQEKRIERIKLLGEERLAASDDIL